MSKRDCNHTYVRILKSIYLVQDTQLTWESNDTVPKKVLAVWNKKKKRRKNEMTQDRHILRTIVDTCPPLEQHFFSFWSVWSLLRPPFWLKSGGFLLSCSPSLWNISSSLYLFYRIHLRWEAYGNVARLPDDTTIYSSRYYLIYAFQWHGARSTIWRRIEQKSTTTSSSFLSNPAANIIIGQEVNKQRFQQEFPGKTLFFQKRKIVRFNFEERERQCSCSMMPT